jgi:Fe-Mn family superoxide dismutase
MSPDGGGEPSGSLGEAIIRDFGSFEDFKEAFQTTSTGVFGSGWGWLVSDASGGLSLLGTPNQDTPLASSVSPVLGIDVWEHAYYLKYQNRRADYVAAFWDVVNWDACAKLYNRAMG